MGNPSLPPEVKAELKEQLGKVWDQLEAMKSQTSENMNQLHRQLASYKTDTDKKLGDLTNHLIKEIRESRKQQQSISDVRLDNFTNTSEIKRISSKRSGAVAAAVVAVSEAIRQGFALLGK